MAAVAKKLIGVAATSIHSEQFFSHVGNIQTNRRSCLTPSAVRMCSFLGMNEDWVDIFSLKKAHLRAPLQDLKNRKRLKLERAAMLG